MELGLSTNHFDQFGRNNMDLNATQKADLSQLDSITASEIADINKIDPGLANILSHNGTISLIQ